SLLHHPDDGGAVLHVHIDAGPVLAAVGLDLGLGAVAVDEVQVIPGDVLPGEHDAGRDPLHGRDAAADAGDGHHLHPVVQGAHVDIGVTEVGGGVVQLGQTALPVHISALGADHIVLGLAVGAGEPHRHLGVVTALAVAVLVVQHLGGVAGRAVGPGGKAGQSASRQHTGGQAEHSGSLDPIRF